MLGNFAIQEILYGVAEDFDGNLLYTLDQLSSASIEVSSDPTEISDKNGNIIRQIYRSKTATFTATSALLSPALINGASGSKITRASSSAPLTMPKVVIVAKTKSLDLTAANYVAGTVKIIGMANNGVNGDAMTEAEATTNGWIKSDSSSHMVFAVPSASQTAAYDQYVVMFDRTITAGEKLVNKGNEFPDTIRLTLYAAVVDPCDDQPKAAYIYIPSFQPDPSVTISLDSENTETDFTGQIQTDYCSCDKELYEIYFPDENAVISATCE